jgi:hypothetical protein
MRTTRTLAMPSVLARRSPSAQPWLAESFTAAWAAGKQVAALPFDALRASHASAVKAGLVPNSILESRDFEHVVQALERATLGPLARRV